MQSSHLQPVICLMGPTASGKSRLAMQLATELPVKLVSVDSALVYRDMNIGTAKPSPAELKQFPHELIDICDPTEIFSAGRFYRDVLAIIERIHKNNEIPLLVGGTMLYFSVLERGIAILPESHPKIRADINDQAEKLGWTALHQKLQKIDEVSASRIKPQDTQRIQRALEVFLLTGKPLSELQKQQVAFPYPLIHVVVAPSSRIILRQKITDRLKLMFAEGFVAEVKNLYERPDIHADLPSMRTVGYRQIWEFLAGRLDESHLQERAMFATCQLAKRQMTWLRQWSHVTWFDSETPHLLQKILSYLELEMRKAAHVN